MAITSYDFITLHPTEAQTEKFAKMQIIYREAFTSLFNAVYPSVKVNFNVDSTSEHVNVLKVDMLYKNERLARYPEIVEGAALKVIAVFSTVRKVLDVVKAKEYLNSERRAANLCMPLPDKKKIEVEHLGLIRTSGYKHKSAEFVEFIQSAVDAKVWYAKTYYDVTLDSDVNYTGVVCATSDPANPVVCISESGNVHAIPEFQQYARYVFLESKKINEAMKKLGTSDSSRDSSYKAAIESIRLAELAIEKFALEYAPQFARSICAKFGKIAVALPVNSSTSDSWERYGMSILVAELQRVNALSAVTNKQYKTTYAELANLAYCPKCGHAGHTEIRDNEVRCTSTARHGTMKIHNVVATNALEVFLSMTKCK